MSASLPDEKNNYLIQLDALRGISVIMVIFSHWAGYHANLWSDNIFWFNGEVGVKMFFVISGFLITGILLQERHRTEQLQFPKTRIARNFYIRRFFRIFPAYYATIVIALLLRHEDVLTSWKWHVSYLSNLLFALRGEYLGDVSHFWSLAVEEQFYLFWPLAMLFLPKRFLLQFITCCICIAPVFRYIAMFILKQNDVTVTVLPVSSLDCLSGGALLAYLRSVYASSAIREAGLGILKKAAIVCGLSFLVFNLFGSVPPEYDWYGVFISRLLLVPTLVGVLILFVNGFDGRLGSVLQSRFVTYPGKISYGIYLFHFFIPGATYWLLTRAGLTLSTGVVLSINLCLLLALASLSWHFFEDPINRFKNYFPYSSNTRVGAVSRFNVQAK